MFIRFILVLILIILIQNLHIQAMVGEVELRADCPKKRLQLSAQDSSHTFGLPAGLAESYHHFSRVAVQFQEDRVGIVPVPDLEKNREYWRKWNDLMRAAVGFNRDGLEPIIYNCTGLHMTDPVSDEVLAIELGDGFQRMYDEILKLTNYKLTIRMQTSYLPPSVALAKITELEIEPLRLAIGDQPRWTVLPHVLPRIVTKLQFSGHMNLGVYPGIFNQTHRDLLNDYYKYRVHHKVLLIPYGMGDLPLNQLIIMHISIHFAEIPFDRLAPTLEELSLTENLAKTPLPPSFCKLVNLRRLDLRKNDVPEVSVVGFTKLTTLNVVERCVVYVQGVEDLQPNWRHPRAKLRKPMIVVNRQAGEDGNRHYFSLIRSKSPSQLWELRQLD